MPKSIILEPKELLANSCINFTDIAVNSYKKTVEQEQQFYSHEEFLDIWRDMAAIREFETILNEIKIKRVYWRTR